MMLNHFVKGRLYNRDLTEGQVFESVGGKQLHITRDSSGHVYVNRAKVVISEVFVYNLGTMYYIDDILYPETLEMEYKTVTPSAKDREDSGSSEEFFTTETPIYIEKEPTTPEHHSILQTLLTTNADVEFVPSEFSEFTGGIEDFSNSETLNTPKALPSRFVVSPPKK